MYLTMSWRMPVRPRQSCLSRLRIMEAGLIFRSRTDLVS